MCDDSRKVIGEMKELINEHWRAELSRQMRMIIFVKGPQDFQKRQMLLRMHTRKLVVKRFSGLDRQKRMQLHSAAARELAKELFPDLYRASLNKIGRSKAGFRRRKPAPPSRVMLVNGAPADEGDSNEGPEPMETEPFEPTGIVFTHSGKFENKVACRAGWGDPKTATKWPCVAQKRVTSTITSNKVQHWSGQNRKMYSSQGSVMGCTALEEATEAKLTVMLERSSSDLESFEQRQWEWLHLISFKLGGAQTHANPQNAGNFVAGTFACNTEMINLEEAIKYYAARGYDFDLAVEAAMYPNSHVAIEIDYYVTRNDKILRQVFYPSSTVDVTKGEIKLTRIAFGKYFGLPTDA